MTFIDGPTFDGLPMFRRMLLSMLLHGHETRDMISCDSFCVYVFPAGNPRQAHTFASMATWANSWGHTLPDAKGFRTPKGYLEIV